MRTLARLLLALVLGATGLVVTVVVISPQARALFSAGDIGPTDEIDLDPLAQNSTVYDAHGQRLAVLHAEENRSPIKLKRVPKPVIETILAVEDEDFYNHGGVNLRATLRALVENVSSGDVLQGGSTITQQVVKNSLLTPEKDVNRKVKEAVLAIRLEDQLSKQQILERYVNTVYLGNGAYGLQAAAEIYFNKDVQQLNYGDAALLAGMISNPSKYDPFRVPKAATDRRRVALNRAVSVGVMDRARANRIEKVPVPRKPGRLLPKPDDYFIEEVKQRLLDDDLLGETETERYNAVFKGGLRIYTTFDPLAQFHALTARNETLGGVDRIALGRPIECIPATPDRPGVGQNDCFTIALVSLDPRTGAVRAMVGGPGFDKYKYNLATQGLRQPGSSFKGYVLMAALESGYVPEDRISGGAPCTFPNPGGTPDPYTASNFGESRGGEGDITSQTLRSSNCAYLRLGQVVGLEKVIDTAHRMGVTAPMDPRIISLPLGVASISPLEMASAYGTIATGGIRHEPYLIERIENRDGKVLFKHQDESARVLGQQTTCLATEILEKNVQSGTGTRARLSDREAAGKTGTAQRFDDAWFVGFTPQLATAVWMGAPAQKEPMTSVGGIRVVGGSYPATIWGRFMGPYLAGQEVLQFPRCADNRPGESLRLPGERKTFDESRPRRPSTTTTTTTRRRGKTTTTTVDREPTTTTTAPGKGKPPKNTTTTVSNQ